MKKYLIPALALGLVMTSCQSDEPFAPGEGGEKQVTFTLTAPTSMTRAGEQSSSNLGGLSNKAANDELHYTLALYYGNEVEYKKSITSIGSSVTFNPTVILGRNYRVVAYADFVGEKADLTSIAIENGINNEKKDAYFANPGNVVFTENDLAEQVTLTRPFGKLRLVATDYSDKTQISNVSVTYRNGGHLNSFNAFKGEFANTTDASATYNAVYNVEYDEETGEKTIFVDYIPVNSDGVFPFEITVTYTNGTESFTRTFAEDIPVKRNALTTLKGNFFTAEAKISVVVDEDFDNFIPGEGNAEEQLRMAIAMGGAYTLQGDIELSKPLNITTNMTLNLNGNTLTATNAKGVGAVIEVAEGVSAKLVGGTIKNTTPNGDAAINNAGELVLDDITIKGAPLADGGYPNYAVYTSGKLVVEEGTTITSDRGALYMSNGADVTINGGNISVTDALGTRALTAHVIYAYGSTSKLTINDGNFALNYNAAEGLGASVICPAGATIKVFDGDFRYYGVQGGQSGIFQNYMGCGAPVDVYGGTFNDNTVTKSGNIAAGYKAVENGGKYYVVPEAADAVATNISELNDALANGDDVVLFSDIAVAKSDAGSNGYGATGISQLNGGVIDGNGNDLSVNAWGTWDSALNTTGGTIKNLNVTGGMRGIFVNHNSTNNSKVILENVVIDGTVYTISCDQGTNQGLEATNSTFNGWTSYATTIGNVKFTNCSFGEGQGYAFCRPYASTTFVGCNFAAGYEIDARATVTFENCTINGVALTEANLATLVTSNTANATVK